jgi:glycosyltransferase involved in cell wall biosynthesis
MIPVRRLSRLLVTLPSTRMGGTERHTAELAARLAARHGMQVELAADPGLHGALARHLGPGVTLHGADLAWETPQAAPRQAAEVARLVAALRPDAAYVPLPWPAAAPGILPALAEAGLPRLVLLHLAKGAPPPDTPPRLGLEHALVVAVSAPVARRGETAWGLPDGAITVLPNPAPRPVGMDRAVARATLRSGLGLPADAPLLLFVGRLEEAKGAELLPDISDRLPLPMAIAGDGPLRGFLDGRAASDPRQLMRMLGPLADPSPWYLAADALLLPSRLEGAPLVFLEAAAHRCPVVATRFALEALGEDAPRLARIAASADGAGMAAAVEAVFADPAGTADRVALAAAHAARQDPEAAASATLGLLRAAMLRAPKRMGQAA